MGAVGIGGTEVLEDFTLADMQETGTVEFRLEDIANRVYNQVHRGNRGEWGSQYHMHDSLEDNAPEQHQLNIMAEFYNNFGGVIGNITDDFTNTLGKLEIKEDYLQATQKELTSIVGSIEEAAKLLERPSKKKIRSLGDLTNSYKQVKFARQAAASELEVQSIDTGPTISYVDPITGKTVTRNQFRGADPTEHLGSFNTQALNDSKAYFKNRVYADSVGRFNVQKNRIQEWWDSADHQLTVIGQDHNGMDVLGYSNFDVDHVLTMGGGLGWLSGAEGGVITQTAMNSFLSGSMDGRMQQTAERDAFNSLVGFSTLREDNNWHHNIGAGGILSLEDHMKETIYDQLAALTTNLYGGLYSTASSQLGGTLAAANAGFGTAMEAFKASEEQKYVAGEKQKALRQSLRDLDEVFAANKRRLLPKENKPKARFTGFKGARPQ